MAKQLAAVLDTLEGVDESLHDFYAEAQDGNFVLTLAGRPRGFVPEGEHHEYRSHNHALENDLNAANEKLKGFDGVDVEVYKQLKATQDDLDRKALIKAGDMEGLVAAEVEKAVKPISGQLETANTTINALQGQLAKKVVDEEILKAGNAFGKMKSGTEDVLVSKATAAGFQEVDGELRQVVNGATQYSVESPGQPMSIREWIATEASKSFSWVWEPSTGGGGGGAVGEQTQTQDGVKIIQRGDREAFRKNLDAIAKGTVKVAPLNE